MSRKPSRGTFLFVWGVPLMLAAATLFGLLAALLGTGYWHVLSWVALSIPILTGLRHALWPRDRSG